MNDYPAPEQRVRAYLDELASTMLRTGADLDEIECLDGGRAPLNASDIRDVLNELDACRAVLEAIELGTASIRRKA